MNTTPNTDTAPTPADRPFAKLHVAKTLAGPLFHLVKHDTRHTLCGRFIDVPTPVVENYPGKHVTDFDCPRCGKKLDQMIEAREI